MPGPIARAFVDIVARFRLEETGDIEAGIRGEIERIEGQLDQLEGSARKAGATFRKQLGDIEVNLNARHAIAQVTALETAVEETTASFRALQTRRVSLQKGTAQTSLQNLDAAVIKLANDLQRLDDDTISLDVRGALTNVNAVETAVAKLEVELRKITQMQFRPDVDAALGDLERLQNQVGETARRLREVGAAKVTAKVEDLQIEKLQADLEEINGKVVTIVANVKDKGVDNLGKRVDKINTSILEFGDQFRNIAFRAASYLAVGTALSAFQRFITFGIQAAGQIETITVSLNRLFADMAELGSTASQFIGQLKGLAIRTPFEFIDLADTSRRLVQLGGDSDLAIERMEALADAGAAVGATSGDINGVVRALSQMAAKGRINLQDLNQVAERLPNFQRQLQLKGVIDELREMGSPLADTVRSFDDLREAGVPIQTVITGIFRGLKDIPGALGAAEAQARTLTGALSNLKDFAQIEFAAAFKGAGAVLADELNAAFQGVGDTVSDASSDMADGIREVIGAFGVGFEDALPSVLGFFEEISGELAGMADAIFILVESLAEGFGGDFARGIINGLTGVLNMITALNDLVSVFGASFAQGLGQVTTQMIALTRVGINVFAPFQKLANDIVFAFKIVNQGVETVSGAIAGLVPSLAAAAATAGALVVFTVITNRMADAARRAREFEQSINSATDSLEEFNSTVEAAAAFLENFEEEGEGVNLGGFESVLDGLTTGEIEKQLGLDRAALAALIADLSDIPDLQEGFALFEEEGLIAGEFNIEGNVNKTRELRQALDDVGLTLGNLRAASPDAAASLNALVTQFAAASEISVRAGVNQKRWGDITVGTTDRIIAAAEATGDWVGAQEQLGNIQQGLAQGEFGDLVGLLDLTEAETQKVIRAFTDAKTGTTDWVGATAELTAQMNAIDDAMLAVEERAEDLVASVDRFAAFGAKGFPLRTAMVDIALSIQEAQLSAEEFDAVATRMGQGLSGEELKEQVEAIAASFDGFKTSFEGVIPSIDDLQFEADSFSLQKFIDELNKIAEARASVTENLNAIVDKYGEFGVRAVETLLAANLNPEQFAIAAQQLVDDPSFLAPLISGGAAVGDEAAAKLAERFTAFGLTYEEARAWLNVGNFEGAGEEAGGAASAAAARAFVPPPGTDLPGGLFDPQGIFGGPATAPTVPSIDVEAAEAEMTTAGGRISSALTTSTQTGVASGFAGSVQPEVVAQVEALAPAANSAATGAGLSASGGFQFGFGAGLVDLSATIDGVIRAAATSPTVTAIARFAGDRIAGEVTNKMQGELIAGMKTAFELANAELVAFSLEASRVAAFAGDGMVAAFELGVSLLDATMQAESDATVEAANAMSELLDFAGEQAGRAVTRGFRGALELPEAVRDEFAKVSASFQVPPALAAAARDGGFRVGFALGTGVAIGISASIASALAAIVNLVNRVLAAANAAAGISSPSTLFAELGRNIAEGVAVGMEQGTPAIEAAAGAMVGAARDSAQSDIDDWTENLQESLAEIGLQVSNQAARNLVAASGGAFQLPAWILDLFRRFGTFFEDFSFRPFAAGGIVTRPTLGLLGERGPEVVTPLAAAPAGGVVHHHENTFNIVAPTEDPEALAARVAARLERRLEG